MLNDKPSKAADIFSLGMTILELATDLELPSNGVFWHELRKKIIDEKYIKCECLCAPLPSRSARVQSCRRSCAE